MNREIKFRAWGEEEGQMYEVGKIVFPYDEYDKLVVTKEGYELVVSTLMQFTGLKDKNGKEIYEGDIVEHYGEVFSVAYEMGSFVIKGESTRNNPDGTEYTVRDDLLMNQIDVLEVIGNIYENPELLTT